ncbi:MAG: isoamylase early set domain-containing protein [Anaerolineae bacterium]|nr:isoamylase early set domain-containing protein [Anaerolineae bacterium]
MVTKKKMKSKTQVTFKMPDVEGCGRLYIVGDFNEWDDTTHPMAQAGDGTWSLSIDLEAGHAYEYRYRTDDGRWLNDPDADSSVPNAFGSDNSVVQT